MKHSEASLTQMLADKYSGRDWAFVPKVPDGTGMAKLRTADGLAMSLWPSKGLHLHGFEIKVARGDWLKEIQDPSKANAFARFCHYWWIVAPAGVLKIEELPSDWGWMCPTPSGNLRTKKAPTFRQTPEVIDYALLAGIFRACLRSSDTEQRVQVANAQGYQRGYEAGLKRGEKIGNSDRLRDEQMETALQRSVKEFEEASGVKIDQWNGERIGEAVAIVLKSGAMDVRAPLKEMRRTLQRVVDRIDQSLEKA